MNKERDVYSVVTWCALDQGGYPWHQAKIRIFLIGIDGSWFFFNRESPKWGGAAAPPSLGTNLGGVGFPDWKKKSRTVYTDQKNSDFGCRFGGNTSIKWHKECIPNPNLLSNCHGHLWFPWRKGLPSARRAPWWDVTCVAFIWHALTQNRTKINWPWTKLHKRTDRPGRKR